MTRGWLLLLMMMGCGAAGVGQAGEPESTPESTPETTPETTPVTYPTASEIGGWSKDACTAYLATHHIEVTQPDFLTPFVEMPVILEGPINGVTVSPKWKKRASQEVMDCRLVAALLPLCAQAADAGVVAIHYYSTYRPIALPEQPCKTGRAGKKCRARQKVVERARQGHFSSRHQQAMAIDIRWFVLDENRQFDVETDFVGQLGANPCQDTQTSDGGAFIQSLACTLGEKQLFNVILTPNANADHHNHLHLDITPGARWTIIR